MRERTVLKIGEFARVNQVSIATLCLPTALPGNEQINIGTLPGGLVARVPVKKCQRRIERSKRGMSFIFSFRADFSQRTCPYRADQALSAD